MGTATCSCAARAESVLICSSNCFVHRMIATSFHLFVGLNFSVGPFPVSEAIVNKGWIGIVLLMWACSQTVKCWCVCGTLNIAHTKCTLLLGAFCCLALIFFHGDIHIIHYKQCMSMVRGWCFQQGFNNRCPSGLKVRFGFDFQYWPNSILVDD